MERSDLARLLGWRGEPTRGLGNRTCSPTTPEELRSALGEAAVGDGCLFLFDRAWGEIERERASAVAAGSDEAADRESGWLCVPTGGTGGCIRFARHDQSTLLAAAEGFVRHFGLERVNAVGVLPLHHVSGFMAWMRCELTGGRHLQADWKRVCGGDFPPVPAGAWVISLVPTQLSRLLETPGAAGWLRRFRCVLLGGGPAWASLLERAAGERIPLAPCYGMTETAAMVAALRPEDFLNGGGGCYAPMPHAHIDLDGEGRVRIQGASVFRGYYPAFADSRTLVTEDLGEWVAAGRLAILGRRDAVIISGGEKVAPSEVEESILSTGMVPDVAVLGVPHPDWGSQVVAFVPAALDPSNETRLLETLRSRLAPYKVPKRFVEVSPWPRSGQGKVSRAALLEAWRRADGG